MKPNFKTNKVEIFNHKAKNSFREEIKKGKYLKSKNKRNANISNGQNKKEFSFET